MENQANQGLLHFKDEGSGRVLVLLHGFTEHLGIWDDFARQLRKEFRLIRVDLPGHGKSPVSGSVHSMEMIADAVKAVLSRARVRRCVMIGHSMGGYVTLSFAARYPSMLRGFGLFHSQAEADTAEGMENRDRVIEVIRQNHGNWIKQFIPDLFAPVNRLRFHKEILDLQAEADKISPLSLIASLEGMKRRLSRLEVLQDAKVPVLFIAGKLDERIPYEQVFRQAALVQHAEILFLRNTAHMGYLEDRASCLRMVRQFTENCYALSAENHSA